MSIKVKQAEPGDKERIFDFIKSAYHTSYTFKIPARWNWEFEQNPYYKGEKYPVFLVEEKDKIIGQSCAMHVPLKIGKKTYTAAWSVDTIVLPEYRGLGAGKLLQNNSAKNHEIFMSLSMSEINRKIKEKFGSIPLSEVWELKKTTFLTGKFLKNYLLSRTKNHPSIHFIAGLFCFFKMNYLFSFFWFLFVFPVKKIMQFFQNNKTENISEIENMDKLSDLWNNVKNQYQFIVEREPRYLKWKYIEQPDLDYKIFCHRENQKITGYIILRLGHPKELNYGIITDILAIDNETYKKLIIFGLNYLSRKKTSIIQIVSSVKEHIRILKQLGFKKEKVIFPMFYSNNQQLLEEVKSKHYSCYFTKGDHDFDQIIPI